jgi:hypothetical protein
MIPVLRNNYLKYHLDKDYIDVNIDAPRLPLRSFYEETEDQIKYVYENKTKPLYIFISGGLDSEFLVHIASELKIDFKVVITRFLNDNATIIYNEYDITSAFNICNKLNIKPIIYDFNFDKFVTSNTIVSEISTNNKSSYSYNLDAYLWVKICKDINGCCLLAGDFHSVKIDPSRNHWNFRILRGSFLFLRTFERYNIEGTSHFLSYSAEQLFSFLLDPEITKLCSNGYPGKNGHESIKASVYNRGNNFNLKPYDYVTHDRIKFTGWEKVWKSPIFMDPNWVKIRSLFWEKFDNDKLPIKEYNEDITTFIGKYDLGESNGLVKK